jgi:uncharacterized protein YyaL (SSP411 family)
VAEAATSALYQAMARYPSGFAHWLCAAAFILGQPQEVAIIGELMAADTQALLNVVYSEYRPNLVIAAGNGNSESADTIPLLAGRDQREGRVTAYVCRRFVCQRPVTEAAALAAQLARRP